MTGLNDIRTAFLKYFSDSGHQVVSSSPLVPRNDPTLMFTNSGMVQFKNIFTGLETRDYSRAVTSQKCVRAGGKHNDLDNVGYTVRHHTFFEMLGNFSFGDYFKEQAIKYCWTLITKEFDIDADRLLATVYHEDEEAADLWKSIAGFTEDRIIRIRTADNFWSMGPVGPCGPCSELFYDYGDAIPGGPPGSADEDGDRFIEIWNLVFMQYEQFDDGKRVSLPHPSIDTGMGLERIAALLQGTNDNFQTDLFRSLIEATADITGSDPDGAESVHHRVIADHLRSSAFLIAEGVMPSKEGRGYVLRRIMRRAMRHAYLFGDDEPVLHRVVPTLVEQMGSAFPELRQAQETIEYVMHDEEERFRRTLGRGLSLLGKEVDLLPAGGELSGEVAFKLYDTYGFPLDLTQDVMRETGRIVDVGAFEAAMDRQRQRAREAVGGIGEAAEERIWIELADIFGATEFLGYETEAAEGQILALVRASERIEKAVEGDSVFVIVNQTPFYAEAGGQVADNGRLISETGQADIVDTQRRYGLSVHTAMVTHGDLLVNGSARLTIDPVRRQRIRRNHSATHLLHETLRRSLGKHVAQRGSLNDADRLRFDFSHNATVDLETLAQIENQVNQQIRDNSPVTTRIMTPDDAINAGAIALFGEKYGDQVRVVSMGREQEAGPNHGEPAYSIELCGGTHVQSTGEIFLFVTTGESAVAAGIRRIEALTGEAAYRFLRRQDQRVAEIALTLNAPSSELTKRIQSLLEERKSLVSEISALRRQIALGGTGSDAGTVRSVDGIQFIGRELTDVSMRDLRLLIDSHKEKLDCGVVALVSAINGKAAAAVGVTDNLTDRLSAVDIIQVMTPALSGSGGGGRANFAQGGGADATGGAQALAAAEEFIGGN
ncbi:MAG: alanine--tRNA ligase [Rhodobacteraceae bacterium]|nr:alanine--tRNA ligase [Paracoccaceae bacterium]MCY4195384.1 alanine--tRNA ligase [Paracoccaceae bacterium]MCY4327033.1 alanine--tRNA ligase [Paracoccaceae bacterium]